MRLLNRRNMRINIAKRTARKRYLVYTTDDFGKPAVDPTRVFASPQPQNRHFRGPVEKVGLTDGTTVADQNYRNQSEAICAVRNVEPRACRANGSAPNAVARLRFAVRNVAPRLQPTPSSAPIAAPRLQLSHGRALIRLQSHLQPRKRFA